MAKRRMFNLDIIGSDAFTEMSISAQSLYFHLGMRADDDGFVNNPKQIMRIVNCGDDDINLLILKKFIIPFKSGVIVIKHWKLNNYIKSDRYTPTNYKNEKKELSFDENGSYTLKNTQCLQNVSGMDTQVRLELGKSKDNKEKIYKKEKTSKKEKIDYETKLYERNLSGRINDLFLQHVETKKANGNFWKAEQGLTTALNLLERAINAHGESTVIAQMEKAIEGGWKGLNLDKIQSLKSKATNPYLEMVEGENE